jgi:hypothetical protein
VFGPSKLEFPMNTKSLAALLAAAALGTLASTSATARDIPAACRSDAASLCPGLVPGDHKFGKCMKSHEAQVSPACKEAAREIRKEHGGGHKGTGVGQMPTPTPQQ